MGFMGSDGNMKTVEWKWIALFVLVLQNSGLALFMRRLMRKEFVEGWRDFLKLFVPSGLYVLQNNLQYIAASNLPADVFQVLSQMKVITTALFSVFMLSRKLSVIQWLSVVTLAGGVGIVQISQSSSSNGNGSNNHGNMIGFLSVLFSALTSGFAGVYFEKVLKSTNSSIWLRNIQMAFIGLGISSMACMGHDADIISKKGFFYGYNSIVWIVILLAAGGGLVVAVVVKYADNIMKGFATSVSIILSSFVSSMVFQDTKLSLLFIGGATLVCGSAFGFSFGPSPKISSWSEKDNRDLLATHKGDDDDDDDKNEEGDSILQKNRHKEDEDEAEQLIEFVPMSSPEKQQQRLR